MVSKILSFFKKQNYLNNLRFMEVAYSTLIAYSLKLQEYLL